MIRSAKEDVETAVTKFRQRAAGLRRNAAITLLAIVLVLASGVAIFLLAGELASREAARGQELVVESRRHALASVEQLLKSIRMVWLR